MFSQSLRQVRRAIVFVVGGSVLLVGLILIFTPGPAVVVVPVGLAILSIEFVWARRVLRKVKAMANMKSAGEVPADSEAPSEEDEVPPVLSGRAQSGVTNSRNSPMNQK